MEYNFINKISLTLLDASPKAHKNPSILNLGHIRQKITKIKTVKTNKHDETT